MLTKQNVVAPLIVVGLVFVLALMLGCPKPPEPAEMAGAGGPDRPMEGGGVTAPTGEPIKIGAIFSVTGAAAALGEPEKMAAELITKQINASGGLLGRPVEVLIEDDKGENTDAVMAAKKLIETEKVCAIIGPSRTGTTMAIKQQCEDAKIPLVSCAAGKPITDPVASYVFAVPQTDALAVAKIIDYLKASSITQVASIYSDDAFGKSGQEQIEKQLGEAGIKLVVAESFGGADTDMTPQLTNIKSKNPGAIICWGIGPGPAHVANNVKKLGITAPLLQSHGVANAKFVEQAGEDAEGVMLPAGRLIVWDQLGDDESQKQVLKDFAEAFKAEYSQDADTFAGHAYDALHIVVEAIKKAQTDEPEKLRDAIEQTKDFVGTAGTFTYAPDEHNGLTKDAFVWVKIEGGAWKLAE